MLVALSLTHVSAGFDVLERVSAALGGLTPQRLVREVPASAQARGAVVLATCNRLEAYLDVVDVEPLARWTPAALVEHAGLAATQADQAVRLRVGDDAVEHLFAVSSGLDSLVVGENEIAGQVRRSYETARASGTTTSAIDRAFQRAAQVSRELRSRLHTGGEDSVAHRALDLADSRVPSWARARVLLVGTGAHARTAVTALAGKGAEHVVVHSATGRGDAFAVRHTLAGVADDLPTALADADVVLVCSGRTAVTRSHLRERSARPLLLIDLGLPRNVDPAVADVPGVELLDLATLARHLSAPPPLAVETAVALAAGHHAADIEASEVVVALRGHVAQVLEEELNRMRRRTADPAEAVRTERALRHLVGVLLHEPTTRARALARTGELDQFRAALATLLGIEAPEQTRP